MSGQGGPESRVQSVRVVVADGSGCRPAVGWPGLAPADPEVRVSLSPWPVLSGMKFGHRILAEMQAHEGVTPASSFFQYKAVKKSIKRLGQLTPDAAQRAEALLAVLEVIEAEVQKVNVRTQTWQSELDWIDGTLSIYEDPGFGRLGEYAALNSTALRKAVKKLDKQLTPSERAGMMRARFDPLVVTDPTRTNRGEASVGGVVRALADPELRAKLPMKPIGEGANAKVWLASLGMVQGVLGRGEGRGAERPGPRVTAVGAADLAIKDGVWRSEAEFVAEVTVQERAASVGVAPQIYFWRWLGHSTPGSTGRGVIGMARLSQPSFFQWLRWLTVQRHRQKAACSAHSGWRSLVTAPAGEWLIDPAVLKLPLVARWRCEARRLQTELRRLNISHGDVHDMNFVFHIPGEHNDTELVLAGGAEAGAGGGEDGGGSDAQDGAGAVVEAARDALGGLGLAAPSSGVGGLIPAGGGSSAADELAALLRSKARKYRLMDAIAQGPGGPARLFVIDFGSARMIKGRVAWLLHDLIGGGYRLADASKLNISPATPVHNIAAGMA